MKITVSKRFFAIAAMFVLALSVFAYTADISGKYKGTANVEGMGTLDITAEIKVVDGKYSGSLSSPHGGTAIVGGKMEADKLTLDMDFDGNPITFSGTVDKESKITGTVSGAVSGTFELTRDAATR